MSFKKTLKKSFWGKYAISQYHCVLSWLLPRIISDEKAVKRYYKKASGRELDLENPKTFSEKTNWLKLNARMPLMQKCADKYDVREYIAEKGYADCLNEIYGVYYKVKDIHPEDLPDRFVLKAAHGSHMNIIVKDKSKVNWRQAKMMMNSWLHQDIYWSGREWVYKEQPRRIIAEAFLQESTGELRDFKFFCFNGEPKYWEVDGDRYTPTQYRNYYDVDCNLLPMHDDVMSRELDHDPLSREDLARMMKIARDLAAPFQFVRVDFYMVDGKIYFGELTYFDNGGKCCFEPIEFDRVFGDQWTLVKDV